MVLPVAGERGLSSYVPTAFATTLPASSLGLLRLSGRGFLGVNDLQGYASCRQTHRALGVEAHVGTADRLWCHLLGGEHALAGGGDLESP